MSLGMKRRDFLKVLSAGTCGAALHNVLSPHGSVMAWAAPPTMPLASNTILVVLNLLGGCSYNIAPIYHGAYRAKMPTTSFDPGTSLPLTSEQGLHPSLVGLKSVYDEGHLALMNLVGYPNENRSHAESGDIWATGYRNLNPAIAGGWLARLSCQIGGYMAGVSLSGNNQIIQTNSCSSTKSISDLNNFGETSFGGESYGSKWLRDTRAALIATSDTPRTENEIYVTSSMMNLESVLTQIQQQTNITLPVTFPGTGLGNKFRDAAKLIAANALGVRLIYVEKGGFDTHSGERQSLTNNLNEVNGAITAFVACMKALNLWDRIILITTSEFSRTFENGSQGTDHGHAAAMIVLGGSVNGGVKTPTPTGPQISAANQYFGSSMIHIDFRQIFKEAIVEMGYDATAVFPETFANTQFTDVNIFG